MQNPERQIWSLFLRCFFLWQRLLLIHVFACVLKHIIDSENPFGNDISKLEIYILKLFYRR